ncbi:multicilin-like isoform X2 [Acipenser ruthenus]|uniref:multicilin-like isoform X2 n=1 Tax=Acipenser ruthenus TaxID=7906 RepID=UPI00145B7883|nr:multicilin-like isoform X2 [Acipenser ruthenus]
MAVRTCYMQFPSWGFELQNARLPDTSDFDLQDFRDAVDNFIPDHPALMQPCLGGIDMQMSSCDVSDFEACITSPIPAPQDHLLHRNMSYTSPTHVHHDNVQPLAEQYWMDMADHNQKALGDALVVNNQLHLTLNRKQEEIASLQERNVKLKELANQAKHLASVLDKLITQSKNTNETTVEDFPPKTGMKRQRLEDLYEPVPDSKAVDDMLRDITDTCHAALQRNAKHPKLQHEMGNSTQSTETINMYGAFNGLQTCTTRSSVTLSGSDMDDGMFFRTSIRDHCTIKTLAFPQGNAFTTKKPCGGYKFRWVPN